MKSRKILLALAAIAAVAIISIACESTFDEEIRPSINLLSLKVQPMEFNSTTGLPQEKTGVDQLAPDNPLDSKTKRPKGDIPAPITESDWDYAYYNVAEGDSRDVWFLIEDHTEISRVIVDHTPGTTVQWGIGNAATRPQRFTGIGEPQPIVDNDVIYVQVSTRDGKYSSYYRFNARLASKVTMLSLLSVAGRETQIRPAEDGRDDWDEAKQSASPTLDISITLNDGTGGSDILATKLNDNSLIEYAIVGKDEDVTTLDLSDLEFTDGENLTFKILDVAADELVDRKGTRETFDDQDLLIAQITAQNRVDKRYYKFRVSVGHIVNISSLVMKTTTGITPAETSTVLALGVPDATWNTVVKGTFATAAATPSFLAEITLEDKDATYEFVKIAANGSNPGAFDSPATMTFTNKDELAIRVKSATETSPGVPAETTFYKVRVELMSAIIKTQPQSAVYFVRSHNLPRTQVTMTIDDEVKTFNRVMINAVSTSMVIDPATPKALEAILDRENAGFTYQWYTANSWYGGYGFDKQGRIVGDPGFTIDAYHPTTERGGLDEKNNVSFHNGGNQFYRLPVAAYREGWESDSDYEAYAIPQNEGGTAKTYIPKIDASKRPFISGYSNQTQYYWVIIKDPSGREVISERAAIVTEWGEKWELGEPTGEKVTKKHHIVDLHAYLVSGAAGLREKPMNTAPFKAGNHGDKHIIPITFPSGFNVKDYSVATIQAKFYLADGRVWIQNWTQGDVGFERSGVGQVLYYNLTNNNATVGLTGDSKEPQGADLNETPTHLVIKPAGTKSITQLPPFKADGKTPQANNDAQGWFTPYIEIVELRFEGPAR